MAAQPGFLQTRILDSYEVLEKIADGGMGSVYRGRHRLSGELVAIKILAPERAGNALRLQRFELEFRAALRLNHPNIVRVLDFGCCDSTHYMAMELVDGPSLGDRLELEGRLPEPDAVDIIIQTATGLHEAHKVGLIHRDVKPDNILLTGNLAKLADLGLVKVLDCEVDLTQTNSGLGTPNFMAPEQFHNAKRADPRCDIYSLGATLYMAVTGHLPFHANTPLKVLKKKTMGDLEAPRRLVPTLSEQIERVIGRAMSVDARLRHASCQEFIADLTGRLHSSPHPSRRKSGVRPAVPKRHCGTERRARVRFTSTHQGSCLPLSSDRDHEWSAIISDISTGGVSLIVNRRFEIGTVLIVQVRQEGAECPQYYMVRVVRHEPAPARKWIHGCAFARELSDDELTTLT